MKKMRTQAGSASPSSRFRFVLGLIGICLLLLVAPAGQVRAYDPVIDLSLGQQNSVVLGDQANSYLSELSGPADFNGDGYDDLLVGAAGHDHNGTISGAAYMILGGPGLPAEKNLAASPANLTVYGASINEALGHSVTGGDVNGDGYDDMIIAADGTRSNRGWVYVVLGDPSRYASPQVIDLAVSDSGVSLIIKGQFAGGRFGRSVASGDINGDGFDDIIAGSYTASPDGRTNAGAVHAILGSSSITAGSTKTIDLQKPEHAAALTILGAGSAASALAPIFEAGEEVSPLFADEVPAAPAEPGSPQKELGDRLGRSVAVADVNKDGRMDIIAGAYGANIGGNVDAGKTYVFYGSAGYSSAAPQAIDLNANPGGANITLNGIDANDQSGFYVSSGDLNGDGYSDILTSAYVSQGAGNAGTETGEAYAVYAGPGLPAQVNLAASASITLYGAASGDRLGRSLASGDINSDGYQDIILGASRADPAGRLDAGMIYVVYGEKNVPAQILLSEPNSSNVRILGTGSTGNTCDEDHLPATDCSSETGHSTSIADINGDGAADVIAGAIFTNNGSIQDAGAAYIIYGSKATSALLSPDSVSVDSGQSVTYTLAAINKFGTWDVTQYATFLASPEAGGSWSGTVYTAGAKAGNWSVTGFYQGVSDSARLTILHGPPVSVRVQPDSARIWAGDVQIFTAWASDAKGNSWDVSGETSFSISSGAGGSWYRNAYTSQTAGSWTVTGTYQGMNDTASLAVDEHNPAIYIYLQPLSTKIWFGEKVVFTAMAVDAQGVAWDVTSKTTFGSDGGLFNGNVFTGSRLGSWGIDGLYQGMYGHAVVTIDDHDDAVGIQIEPAVRLIQVGEKVSYIVRAVDAKGRAWDVTEGSSFSTQSGSGGSWNANVFTPSGTGTWILKASYNGMTKTATLTVMETVYKLGIPIIRK